MRRSPRSSASFTQRSASPSSATSSSIFSTRLGAPPCSGPLSAPTAALSAAAASAPVEATTRAVNVDAFMPCSAAEIQYASIALTWSGFASPRQRIRKRSGIERPLSTSACGTGGWPAPDLLVGHDADEVLDVDSAVAQCASRLVRLGDRGGKGDDALEAGLDVGDVRRGGLGAGAHAINRDIGCLHGR